MMNVTHCSNAGGSIAYYLRDNAELGWRGDYIGRGCGELDLRGRPDDADVRGLIRGKGPEGEKLAQKYREDRRCLTDYTLSLPKSAAIAYAFADEEKRKAIRRVVEEAARETATLIEEMTQAKVKGELVHTGNAVFVPIFHEVSRSREPNLHVHLLQMNTTHRDGKWYAVEPSEAVNQTGYLRAVFHNSVARGLVGLGYGVMPTKDNYRVIGIPGSACEKLSGGKGRIDHAQAVIEQTLQEQIEKASLEEMRGLENRLARVKSPKGRAVLAVSTRERKKYLLDPANLMKEWEAKLTPRELEAVRNCTLVELPAGPLGKALRSMSQAVREKPRDEPLEPKLMREAFDAFMETDSRVTSEQVMTHALKAGMGRVSLDRLKVEVDKLPAITHKGMLTTEAAMQDEADLVDYARKGLVAWRKEPVVGLPDASKQSMRDLAEFTRKDEGRILLLAGDARQREGQPLRVLREHGIKPIETLVYKAPKVMPAKGWKEKMRRFMKRLRTQPSHETQREVGRAQERPAGRER